MPKDYVKTHPRILERDIYDYISTHSNISKKTAKECFELFSQMIEELALSQYLLEETTICFPKIGMFYFKSKAGRKKGLTYYLSHSDRTITLEEDEPTTYKLNFKVSPTLHQRIKQRWKK